MPRARLLDAGHPAAMDENWLDERHLFLTDRCPLPLRAPFTVEQAGLLGVSRQTLRTMVSQGLVRRMLQGVYVAAQATDDMDLRAHALALVIPQEAVVTDRTAAWLHGVELLPRSSGTIPPPVQVFHTTDTRVRRAGADSGRRGLLSTDITVVQGIRVTTALRTALDLGRLLRRHDALGAIDGFLRIGVPQEILMAEIARFKGYRGVRQLRVLAPLGDGRAESMGESALRLDWTDAGLPRPDVQTWVYDDNGVGIYRLDMTLPELLFAAEYDGEEHHSADADQQHDRERREWCARERHWVFEIFTKADVYERRPDPLARLAGAFDSARKRTLWTPYGRAR
jgi:hypothetical protein